MSTFAYLDAGSGSMIAGAVAAGAAGMAVAAKMGWRRVTGKFSKGGEDETVASVDSSEDAEAEAVEDADETPAPVSGDA